MARLDNFRCLKFQSVAVFDHDNSSGKSVADQCFHCLRHPRRCFATTGDIDPVKLIEIEEVLADLKPLSLPLNRIIDRGEGLSSRQTCEKYLPRMCAQIEQRRHWPALHLESMWGHAERAMIGFEKKSEECELRVWIEQTEAAETILAN